MNAVEKLVDQALFGTDEIKGEPQNFYIHRDALIALVGRSMSAEREACAMLLDAMADAAQAKDEALAAGIAKGIGMPIRSGTNILANHLRAAATAIRERR